MHPYMIPLSFLYLLIFSSQAMSMRGEEAQKISHTEYSIGAIVNLNSRVGKEAKVAMEMAIDDSYLYTAQKPVLHIRDYGQEDTTHAAFAAMPLLNERKVGAILSFYMGDEVASIGKISNRAQVPILSFVDTIPTWSSKQWPFLVHAKHGQYKEMDVVAAIIGTWGWKKVNFIYEDTDYATSVIVPRLIDALQEVRSAIDNILPLPPITSSLFEELEKLKREQCRVFIIHSSWLLAKNIFFEAKKLGLMEKDSVWITTSSITDNFNVDDASVISSMQGVLGVKTYYPQSGKQYEDFNSKFRKRFQRKYPEEVSRDAGILPLQTYDAVRAVAAAMGEKPSLRANNTPKNQMGNASALHGVELLEKILLSDFKGLTGEFRFINRTLIPSNIFHIVNMVGQSFRQLGIWSDGLGFSKDITSNRSIYNTSMTILGRVLWPRGTLPAPKGWAPAPRGWALSTSVNPLRIGVPENATFNQFVNVRYDDGGKTSVNGFSIDVFNVVLEKLGYYLPHEFVPYNGTYDSLVEQIYHNNFDAVVGDTSIVARRCDFAEFSQPWTDSGLQMVVLKNSQKPNRAWLFLKPFTAGMWGLTASVNIYNGFSLWLMERKHHPEFNGSASNKLGVLIWLAFATLFSLHGDKLHSNLSRITMLVWLFVAIIIIQSYTANLTSMLTIPRIESKGITVEHLRNSNAKVGCDGGSFVVRYLEEALGIDPRNIIQFYSYTDYPQALEKGQIAAAFLEIPYIKVFLAKHCKGFALVGPVYKVGGFAFVFSKGSPILPDISKAVLEVSENGKLLEMENALLSSYNCSDPKSEDLSLGVTSFWGLFLITGVTTTITLLIYVIHPFRGRKIQAKGKQTGASIHATPKCEHDPDIDERCMFASEMGQ
ncbi:hypothetical protein ACHQM5_017668 [Ranunculus cassubicifolius]